MNTYDDEIRVCIGEKPKVPERFEEVTCVGGKGIVKV